MESNSNLPENIRMNLKQFSEHAQTTCLECGYVGLAGIISRDSGQSKAAVLGVFIGLFVLGFIIGPIVFVVGLVAGGLLALNSAKNTKTIVKCPSCLNVLELH